VMGQAIAGKRPDLDLSAFAAARFRSYDLSRKGGF